MKIKLPTMTPWQLDVFSKLQFTDGSGQTVVVKSPRQVGKSFFLKVALLYTALKKANSSSVLLEPVGFQARRMQREMNKALKKTGLIETCNLSDGYITFVNGSEISFKSAEQGDSLRGLTVSGIFVIDEAAFITDSVYEICLPFTNVHRAPKLIVSSPLFKEGFFYNEFSDPNNIIFDWNRKSYDFSMFLSDEDYEKYKKKYTKTKFKTEVLGEFIEAWSTVFGDFKRCIKIPTDMKPVYGGLDWGAATGNDETCLTLLNKDKEIVYRWASTDLEPTAQVDILSSIINSFPSLKAVYVEKNSIGNVYLSMLRRKVTNNGIIRAFETVNEIKREIIENLIVAFEQNLIGIDDDPILAYQLAGFEMKKLKKGYTYGNDKDSTHDDRVMSLAFAYSMFSQKPPGTIGFSKK